MIDSLVWLKENVEDKKELRDYADWKDWKDCFKDAAKEYNNLQG